MVVTVAQIRGGEEERALPRKSHGRPRREQQCRRLEQRCRRLLAMRASLPATVRMCGAGSGGQGQCRPVAW